MPMRNVDVKVTDKAMVLTIPFAAKNFAPSGSGKSVSLATTGAKYTVPTALGDALIGLNVTVKASAYKGEMGAELRAEAATILADKKAEEAATVQAKAISDLRAAGFTVGK